MTDILFQCPKCDKSLAVDERGAGRWINCPDCGNAITIPQPNAKLARAIPVADIAVIAKNTGASDVANNPMRKCPFCAEEIRAEAIKCKHCGSMINEESPVKEVPTPTRQRTHGNEDIIAVIMLLIPVIAAVVTWFWIGNMRLIDNPASMLTLIAIFTVVVTAVLAGVEANNLGMGNEKDLTKKGYRNAGPAGWVLSLLLFWMFAYPYYFVRRAKYGVRNYGLAGLLSMLVFMAVVLFMDFGIRTVVTKPDSVTIETTEQAPPPPSAPQHSEAYQHGYNSGVRYADLDKKYATYDFASTSLDASQKTLIPSAYQYRMGSQEFGDFWEGYDDGYYGSR